MRVAEIFSSIHGECNGHLQGRVVSFIRLSGCNLRCYYCDTEETQSKEYGKEISILEICCEIDRLGNRHVCITGGEPLLSPSISELLHELWYKGYKISVETNGTISITPYFRYVDSFVVDFKSQSTGYSNRMRFENYIHLRKSDVIKFVVANEEDVSAAKSYMDRIERYGTNATYALSPVYDQLKEDELYELIRKYGINNAVLSLQIHKFAGFC